MHRLCYMESWARVLTKSSMEEKLRALLALLAEKFELKNDDALLSQLKLTHEHLAQALGCMRSSVSRTLLRLKATSK